MFETSECMYVCMSFAYGREGGCRRCIEDGRFDGWDREAMGDRIRLDFVSMI